MREHGGQFQRNAARWPPCRALATPRRRRLRRFALRSARHFGCQRQARINARAGLQGRFRPGQPRKALWALAQQLLPNTVTICRATPRTLMDLGGHRVHPRQPACSQCPLQAVCQAHHAHAAERYPHQNPQITPQQPGVVAAVCAMWGATRWNAARRKAAPQMRSGPLSPFGVPGEADLAGCSPKALPTRHRRRRSIAGTSRHGGASQTSQTSQTSPAPQRHDLPVVLRVSRTATCCCTRWWCDWRRPRTAAQYPTSTLPPGPGVPGRRRWPWGCLRRCAS